MSLVADDSLVRTLDTVQEFRRLKNSGKLPCRPVADELILDLARGENLQVITRDHYVDHRAEHRWIEDRPERFHRWRTVSGAVRFEPLGIRPHSRQTVSRERERKELKRVRIDPGNPRHRRILETRWKCGNAQCCESAHWQDQILRWPALDRAGEPVCPSCGTPPIRLGPRDAQYEVVVEECWIQHEVMRFPVEVGCPVIVGRGSHLKGIDLGGGEPTHRSDIKQVSRRHVLLRIEENGTSRRLVAVDLTTRNRTEVERWTGLGLAPRRDLPSGKDVVLGFKDRLTLGGAVTLRLSGKVYATGGRGSVAGPPLISGAAPETSGEPTAG